MSPLRAVRDGLGDESVRVAILVGLATVPFTVAFSWESAVPALEEGVSLGGSISGGALVLAGVIVGYYYNDRPTEASRAGSRAGLAASLGTILVYGADTVVTVASASWPWTAAAALLGPVVIGFGIALTVFVTMVSALGTDWVLTRLDGDRRADDLNADGSSRWWLAIAVNAVVAPVTLYTLWTAPEGGGELRVLGAAVLIFLTSNAALLGLFIDATEPGDPQTDWLPNVWAYVAGPIGAGVLAYSIAAARGVDFPPGYGQYGFFAACWLASAAYLVNKYRHRTNGRGPASTV